MLAAQSSSRYNGFGLSPQTHHSNWQELFTSRQSTVHSSQLSVISSPVYQSTSLPVHSYQLPVNQSTTDWQQTTDNGEHTTHYYTITLPNHYTNPPLTIHYFTTHYRQTTDNCQQKTENPPLTISPLHHYTTILTNHTPLITPLGLIEFSIQWL